MNNMCAWLLAILVVLALAAAGHSQITSSPGYVPLTLFEQYLQSDFVIALKDNEVRKMVSG